MKKLLAEFKAFAFSGSLLDVAIGLAIGVAWEIVEALFDPLLTGTFQHGLSDTATDVASGGFGGAVAWLLARAYRRRRVRGSGTDRPA